MKSGFNTYDIVCGLTELQKLVGLRVNQIYDIDNKTYLIRFQGGETKTVLLIESGVRFHTTSFEWPKNVFPSGFCMKLRKHLKNKRLEILKQLGADRIVDFQFGANEAAYHVIIELYDRGNIILTDHELTILYILRPHYEGEDVRFSVRERYPSNRAKTSRGLPTECELREILKSALPGENLKSLLMSLMDCGPSVIEHVLINQKLDECIISGNADDKTTAPKMSKNKQRNRKGLHVNTRAFDINKDCRLLMLAIKEADELLQLGRSEVAFGYIIQNQEEKPTADGQIVKFFYQNLEYHPFLFEQCKSKPYVKYDSFMLAVDEFYSKMEGQKIDLRTLRQEREALKKLCNVKKDHAKRLNELSKAQECDKQKAELITRNQSLVDNAILAIRSAIANQMPWPQIYELVKAAQANNDPVARTVNQLKLEINHISLSLADPYCTAVSDTTSEMENIQFIPNMVVDVDLGLSAWANARRYYDQKRYAAKKEQKTIDASQKALKSAERKTQQVLKDVRTISTISKARKVYWFEKFYWFISSENYLVIGGRDAQQNELIVKRYMRPTDIYVHAEIQGASSVVIRNPSGNIIPPKTLHEAGTMAISYSVAWDAKVVTNAYWVRSDQVSKTAPTGEYLGTGSFMVRGKKNFLPPCHLIMGVSMLFKLENNFIEKHQGERKVRSFEEYQPNLCPGDMSIQNEKLEPIPEELNIELDKENENEPKLGETEVSSKFELEQKLCDNTEGEIKFPDTQIKIEHSSISDNKSSCTDVALTLNKIHSYQKANETTLIIGAPSRKKHHRNAKKCADKKVRQAKHESLQNRKQQSLNENGAALQLEPGKGGKLNQIKSIIQDHNVEERVIDTQIHNSAVTNTLVDISHDKKESQICMKTINESQTAQKKYQLDDGEEMPVDADVEMLDTLTGIPFEDDELLFGIPVVAPYQALQNFKYKVKLTPGTGKRGSAAKMALIVFAKDKACSAREKDILKSIKEETVARNIPGKVKLSAPQLQKFKK